MNRVHVRLDRDLLHLGAGAHTADWDAREAASGVYSCRIETPGFSQTRKMILLK